MVNSLRNMKFLPSPFSAIKGDRHGRRAPAAALPAPAIHQLHHYAYRPGTPRKPGTSTKTSWACRCTTSSRATTCRPSTGEYCPYTHFFFRLQDGSFIAF